jgi:hypothetical protein
VLLNIVIPFGLGLCLVSALASCWLQCYSGYDRLHGVARVLRLRDKKLFFRFLVDFVANYTELKVEVRDRVLNKINRDLREFPEFHSPAQKVIAMFDNEHHLTEIKAILAECTGNSTRVVRKVWNTPPMHKAANSHQFGVWCFLNMIGGIAGALNGQSKSSINCIFENYNESECSFVTRWWVKRLRVKYSRDALLKAVKLGDVHMISMLIANGYDVNTTSGKKSLLMVKGRF